MDIHLQEMRLEDLSEIVCRFHVGKHPQASYPKTILVVHYEGTYRYGSRGHGDATFMFAMGNAGVNSFDPDAIILDLTALSYEWGDGLDCLFGIGDEVPRPTSMIVGPLCRQAIGTLCFGERSKKDACQYDGIFDTLEDAWNYVSEKLDANEDQRT